MEQTERKQPDLWNELVAAVDKYVRTAPLSDILRPEGDEPLVLTAPTARLLADRAAALETRVADLQGVSDANDTLAVALDQERRHSAEMLSQRNQAIDHVRRLHAQVADAAQLLGSISLTHPHLVPAEWAECGPEVKP